MKKEINISALLGFIVAFAYWVIALVLARNSIIGVDTIGNIEAYIIFICIFLGVFFIAFAVLTHVHIKHANHTPTIILNVSLLFLISFMFCKAIKLYAPIWAGVVWKLIMILLVSVSSLIILWALQNDTVAQLSTIFKAVFTVIAFLLLVLVWYKSVETSNVFSHIEFYGTLYNTIHSSAYIDQIYAVFYSVPFTGGQADQYGHYGLFFVPIIRIIGPNMHNIAKIIGLVAASTAALFMYAAYSSLSGKTSKIICYFLLFFSGAIPAVYNVYWQTYPHRLVVPAIIMAYVVFLGSKRIKLFHYFLGCCLCIVGLIWSNDSGLVALFCWTAFVFSSFIKQKGIAFRNIVLDFLICLVILCASVGIAWGVVNIYNHAIAGSFLSIFEYFGLNNMNYLVGLEEKLEFWDMHYIFKIIIFLYCLARSSSEIIIYKSNEKEDYLEFTASIMALGLSTYYIHNTYAGNETTNPFYIMCLCSITSRCEKINIPRTKETIKTFIGNTGKIASFSIAAFAIILMSLMGIRYIYFAKDMTLKYYSDVYDYSKFTESVEEIEKTINYDTAGVGIGTSALFFEMGRDRGTYRFGAEDLIFIQESKPDSFIIWQGYGDSYVGYKPVKSFKIDQETWTYYQKMRDNK